MSIHTTTCPFPTGMGSGGSLLSPEAQQIIKSPIRFTDYLRPEVWPLCREGIANAMRPDSDRARQDLLQSVVKRTIGGCRVLELIPKCLLPLEKKVILYIHVGAFTLGAPDFQMQIPAPLAQRTGWKVIAVDYPLPPYAPKESDYPAHKTVLNVYRELLKEYEHCNIAILGHSAGGNIAFGFSLMAKDEMLPLPGATVTYAPWVDLEQTGNAYSDQERIAQTVVLTPPCLASARDAAFGINDHYSSYISPIQGDYSGFSDVNIAIFTAGRDLLREEGQHLAEQIRGHAKIVQYYGMDEGWHGYQEHYLMPEAEKCADQAATFLCHHLRNDLRTNVTLPKQTEESVV